MSISAVFDQYLRQYFPFKFITQCSTPFLLYSQQRLQLNFQILRNMLTRFDNDVSICYAIKACPVARVLAQLKGQGAGFEVQSLLEANILQSQQLSNQLVMAHGCGKSDSYIEKVLEMGGVVVANSANEWQRLNKRLPSDSPLGIRIAFDQLELGRFSHNVSKLGIPASTAHILVEAAARAGRKQITVHNHSLSRTTDAAVAQKTSQQMIHWLNKLSKKANTAISRINLGGGLEPALRFDTVNQSRETFVEQWLGEISSNFEKPLVIEPGHGLIEDAAIAVTTIKDIYTDASGTNWVIVDIGTNILVPIPSANFSVHPLNANQSPNREYNIADSACSPAAVIAYNAQLPVLHIGERLIIGFCGAYTHSLAEVFCQEIPQLYWYENEATIDALFDADASRQISKLLFQWR